MKFPKEVNSLLMVALVLLAAAIPNQVTLPVEFYKLVEDKTNVILLMALCVLVSYCNLPLGAMMSIFVMMVMVNNPRIEGFENEDIADCDPNSNTYTPNHPDCGAGAPDICETDPNDPSCLNSEPVDCATNPDDPSCQPSPVDCTITPDDPSCQTPPPIDDVAKYTDFNGIGPVVDSLRSTLRLGENEDGAKQFCGALNMLSDKVQCPMSEPFDMLNSVSNSINKLAGGNNNSNNNSNKEEYNNINNSLNNSNDDLTEGFMGAMSNEPQLNNNQSEDFVKQQLNEQTKQVALKQGHDYDVIGCRYDLQGNLNNDFLQGPPVAKCSIYDMAETQNIGCEFYPINP